MDLLNPSMCLVCIYGFYPEGNQCMRVSKKCADHNVQTGDCFNCRYNL